MVWEQGEQGLLDTAEHQRLGGGGEGRFLCKGEG